MLITRLNESRHDFYPQFPRSSIGTRGLQTRSHRKKNRMHFKILALLKQARLKNQNVVIILTRSLTLHMALEAVLFGVVVVVLYCKSVAQAKGGKTLLI